MTDVQAYDLMQIFNQVKEGKIDDIAFRFGFLKDECKDEFKKKFEYACETNKNVGLNGKDNKQDKYIKGKALEDLVQFLFVASGGYYKTISNVHTTTNEIDVLACLSGQIGMYAIKQIYGDKFEKLLCECKNHKERVNVTYVGKFCHLTMNSSVNIGIMFSINGIKKPAKNLIQKTYYYKEKKDEKIYIIDFAKKEFERFINGESFLDIIKEKCNELELDIDFTKYITNHPNENEVQQWLMDAKKP